MKGTQIKIRNNKEQVKPFQTDTGCPQGDSLSPVLFTIYLEACLKEAKQFLPVYYQIIAYADDVNFLLREGIDLKNIKEVFAGWNLVLNEGKTEINSIGTMTAHGRIRKKLAVYWGLKGKHLEGRNSLY